MHLELDLPVYHMTEEQLEKYELGLEVDLKDCFLVTYTFYTIENIKATDEKTCSIQSGGLPFVINMTADKVKGLVREKRLPYLN